MKYNGVLIAVSDMENSRRFYRDVLGLKAVEDFGANVTLEGGIFLQTLDTWKTFIQSDQVILPNHAGELYFEEEDIEGFCGRLASLDICYVDPLFEHRWGQRVVRFYDPDGHVIEVGERWTSSFVAFSRAVCQRRRRLKGWTFRLAWYSHVLVMERFDW